MHSFKGLAHIGLYSGDAEKTKAFYMNQLGFALLNERVINKKDGAWVRVVMLTLGDMTMEVIEHSDQALHKTGNSGCVDHLAIEVENLPEIIAELRKKGISFLTEEPTINPDMLGGAQYIYLLGPSGESIELFERLTPA